MLISNTLNPTDSCRGRQCSVTEICGYRRVRAMDEKQLQKFDVARLSGADKRCCARLEEPLHRENRTCERIVLAAEVWIGPMIQENPDQIEMIHVRLWYREVSAFDFAVICRQIQWSPSALVRQIHVCAVFDEPGCKFVVSVVRGREQWGPSVFGGLIHIGSSSNQQFRGFQIPF